MKVPLLTLALSLAMLAGPATASERPYVRLDTDLGAIVLQLYPDKAPKTVAHFLDHVDSYYYDGVIFHRVIDGFVIQTGRYRFDLTAKDPGDTVVNESDNGLKNLAGTVAMARFTDPDSARAQFYINLADNPNLDPKGDKPGYTVFGRVVKGMDVVRAIGKTPVHHTGIFDHLPVQIIRILKARRVPAP